MITFMKGLLIFIAIVATPVIWYKINYPSYSWHQKLTVEVETPDGIISGSSVTRVEWTSSLINDFWAEASKWKSKVQGEAVVVDLGNDRYLFALMGYSGDESYTQNLATSSLYDTTDRRWGKEAFRRVIKLKEPIAIPQKLYPILATFADINDSASVKHVEPPKMANVFGEGYKLKNITLELTDEPVTRGRVEGVLKWIYTVESLTPRELQPRLATEQTIEQKMHLYDFIDIQTWAEIKRSEREKQ